MNAMLTVVAVPCLQCGSTAEVVKRDEEILGKANAVCCEIAELIRLDPREPYAEDEYSEPLQPEVACFYCGCLTCSAVGRGKRASCSTACWGDYAE